MINRPYPPPFTHTAHRARSAAVPREACGALLWELYITGGSAQYHGMLNLPVLTGTCGVYIYPLPPVSVFTEGLHPALFIFVIYFACVGNRIKTNNNITITGGGREGLEWYKDPNEYEVRCVAELRERLVFYIYDVRCMLHITIIRYVGVYMDVYANTNTEYDTRCPFQLPHGTQVPPPTPAPAPTYLLWPRTQTFPLRG